MKRYKHYSFDLWGTLIKSNPQYKIERAEFFRTHFNRALLTQQQIANIFVNVSATCTAVSEVTCLPVYAEQMYTMVLHKMAYPLEQITIRDIASIIRQMDMLLLKHHPILYDEYTKNTLYKLYETGATISLLSNTGFARGAILREVIGLLDIENVFHFQIYSNERGLCKPSPQLFQSMFERAATMHSIRYNGALPPSEVLHVGDNTKADINAANAAGIQGFFVNSHGVTIKNLL